MATTSPPHLSLIKLHLLIVTLIQVPYNTPESLSSSSSAESSPEMPLRKQKILEVLRETKAMDDDDDDEYNHLDFRRDDHLSSFCRTKLNRVTARSMYLALMEMRKKSKDSKLKISNFLLCNLT